MLGAELCLPTRAAGALALAGSGQQAAYTMSPGLGLLLLFPLLIPLDTLHCDRPELSVSRRF